MPELDERVITAAGGKMGIKRVCEKLVVGLGWDSINELDDKVEKLEWKIGRERRELIVGGDTEVCVRGLRVKKERLMDSIWLLVAS